MKTYGFEILQKAKDYYDRQDAGTQEYLNIVIESAKDPDNEVNTKRGTPLNRAFFYYRGELLISERGFDVSLESDNQVNEFDELEPA